MKGYIADIEKETLDNIDYRRVIYTGKFSQLVVMNLQPGDEIGEEIHNNIDQFIRIESGKAKVVLNSTEEHNVEADWAVIIPAGMAHNVINTGDTELKLYSIYSPPEHRHDVVQTTKADDKEEHFDGTTTE